MSEVVPLPTTETLLVGGQSPVPVHLPYACTHVEVDNHTNQYLQLTDTTFVAPGIRNRRLNLVPPRMDFQLKFAPPPGITAAAPNTGEAALVTFFPR